MPALNPRITEGSDLVRDSTPTPQQRAQSVLRDLSFLDGFLAKRGPLTDEQRAEAHSYVLSAKATISPLAYPRLMEEKR